MNSYSVIGRNGRDLKTDGLLHPGEVLASEIEARGILKSDLAAALGIKPGNLTELLKGKRHVSALLALKMETLLGIDASLWLRLQGEFDLGVAKRSFTKSQHVKLRQRSKTLRRKVY